MRRILSVLFVFFCVAIPSGQDPRAGTTPEQEAAQLTLRLQTREGRQELIRDRERLRRMMEEPKTRRELVRNRDMVREMLQKEEIRADIRGNEAMIREMERNREARQEMEKYTDLRGEACQECPGAAPPDAARKKEGGGGAR
jgi:hypothetical protein